MGIFRASWNGCSIQKLVYGRSRIVVPRYSGLLYSVRPHPAPISQRGERDSEDLNTKTMERSELTELKSSHGMQQTVRANGCMASLIRQ